MSKRFAILLLLVILSLLFPNLPSAGKKYPFDAADTAWMLTATALVLIMTPGLAFFYGGIVNMKNVVSTSMV